MSSTPLRHSPRRGAPALAALVVAILLSACGSSSTGSSTASGSDASGGRSNAQDTAQTRLQDCLRKQGVDLPSTDGQGGVPDPSKIDRTKLQSALKGPCKSLQEAAGGGPGGGNSQEFRDQLTTFTSCMRKQGVDVPDPSTSGGAPSAGAIDQDDPKVKAAIEACRDSLPQGLPGGGG